MQTRLATPSARTADRVGRRNRRRLRSLREGEAVWRFWESMPMGKQGWVGIGLTDGAYAGSLADCRLGTLIERAPSAWVIAVGAGA